MKTTPTLLVAIALTLAATTSSFAQTPTPKDELGASSANPLDPAAIAKEITTLLAGTDAESKDGLARAEKLLASEPAKYTSTAARAWLKSLLDTSRFEAADALALKIIIAVPSETPTVEAAQATRVRALLAQGPSKSEQALAAAKSLFNVSTLAGTSAALLSVAEALNATHPGDVTIVKQFRAEQIAGAKPPETLSTQPAPKETTTDTTTEKPSDKSTTKPAEGALHSPTLRKIKIDPAPYEDAFKKIIGEDYASLVAKGNLLLLADRIPDAREMFERAYGVGADANLVAATENLARIMKAEDGTIGRANAWILSLRPANSTPAKSETRPPKTPKN